MAPQKETIMLLKVDLDCARCYKKVKKLLCSIPQIKDQVYNEKQNTVMIKVVCCSPEKIRDKLCCKGAKCIKSTEIVEPPKPAPPPKPEPPKPAPPPKPDPPKPAPPPKPDPPKPAPPPKPDPPKPAPPPKPDPPPPVPTPMPEPIPCRPVCCSDCYEGRNTGPCDNGYGYDYGYRCRPPPPPPPGDGWRYYEGCPKPAPPPKPDPPPPVPTPMPEPIPCRPVCCSDCYEGRNTGPCYNGYGYDYGYRCRPPPPPPPGDGWRYYEGYPPCAYGYRPGYFVNRCEDYCNDENPTACVIT